MEVEAADLHSTPFDSLMRHPGRQTQREGQHRLKETHEAERAPWRRRSGAGPPGPARERGRVGVVAAVAEPDARVASPYPRSRP
eukprot:scaffold1523_cov426-Prasinococcus_capsulatus_cf.AAC.12